ncbi:hypothetical protein D3C86_2211550 [compost metagenome]
MPGQCRRQIGDRLPLGHTCAQRIDPALLLWREHFQQQAALCALRLQCLQQPELQGVMIGIVMRLADQHARY